MERDEEEERRKEVRSRVVKQFRKEGRGNEIGVTIGSE
jgi:hypothetical protein